MAETASRADESEGKNDSKVGRSSSGERYGGFRCTKGPQVSRICNWRAEMGRKKEKGAEGWSIAPLGRS